MELHHHADKSRYGTDGNIDPAVIMAVRFAHGDNDKPGIVNEKVEEHLGLCNPDPPKRIIPATYMAIKRRIVIMRRKSAVQASCTFFHLRYLPSPLLRARRFSSFPDL